MRTWVLAVTILGVAWSAPGAGAAVYDVERGCVDPGATPAAVSLQDPGDPLEVLFEPGAGNEAGAQSVRADQLLGRPDLRMAALFTRGLGRTVGTPPTVGGAGAYRTYVVGSLGIPGALAATVPSCENLRQSAIVVERAWASNVRTPFIVAHEFGHVFQTAVSGRTLRSSWWSEATAEYAGRQIERPFDDFGRDEAFLGRPGLPLDSTRDIHAYGAWRFVEWLDARMGDRRFWAMLRKSFERHAERESLTDAGDEPDTTRVVRRVLEETGRDLDADLPRFWADHLRPTADNGPAAARTTLAVAAGTRTRRLPVRRLAARLLDLRPAPSVRQLRVRVTFENSGVLYVTGPLRRIRDVDRTFCVGASGRYPRLPDDLAFAFTNLEPRTQSLSVRIDARTDDAGCRRPERSGEPVEPPDAAACGAREGTYDTGVGATRVKLSVDCFRGRLSVQGITGQVPCAPGAIPLGTGTDTYYLLRQEADDGDRLLTSYAPGSTTSVSLDVHFAGSAASGTVRAVTRNPLTGEPNCTSATESFVASTG